MFAFKIYPTGVVSPLSKVMASVCYEQRIARGWSTETLAARAGLSRQEIENIEARRRVPTSDTMERLATGMGLELPEFYALGLDQMARWPARCQVCNNCCVDKSRLMCLNAQWVCTRPGV